MCPQNFLLFAQLCLVSVKNLLSLDLDGKQVELINSRISLLDIIPNTPTSTKILVTGEV